MRHINFRSFRNWWFFGHLGIAELQCGSLSGDSATRKEQHFFSRKSVLPIFVTNLDSAHAKVFEQQIQFSETSRFSPRPVAFVCLKGAQTSSHTTATRNKSTICMGLHIDALNGGGVLNKEKKFQPDIVPTMTFEMMEELSVQERFNNYSSLIKRPVTPIHAGMTILFCGEINQLLTRGLRIQRPRSSPGTGGGNQ